MALKFPSIYIIEKTIYFLDIRELLDQFTRTSTNFMGQPALTLQHEKAINPIRLSGIIIIIYFLTIKNVDQIQLLFQWGKCLT